LPSPWQSNKVLPDLSLLDKFSLLKEKYCFGVLLFLSKFIFTAQLKEMTTIADSKALGLQRRTVIENISHDTMAIVINRKSRIIMADGRRIVANAAKIMKAKPGTTVALKTMAPVCSKTIQYLADHRIKVIRV
jgi:hypothetical protein